MSQGYPTVDGVTYQIDELVAISIQSVVRHTLIIQPGKLWHPKYAAERTHDACMFTTHQ